MKIAVTASAEGIDCAVDPRFGRAAYFAVVDTETGRCNSISNDAVSAAGGAGITAAEAEKVLDDAIGLYKMRLPNPIRHGES